MDCSIMSAALACVTLVLELKEHRSRRRLELLTRGLQMRKVQQLKFSHLKVPRSSADQCAKAVFLRGRRPIRDNFIHTPYTSTGAPRAPPTAHAARSSSSSRATMPLS
jgi:hypothetical protein